MNILIFIGTLAVVVGLFNLFIFIHELGHFFAAKWRGLKIDRFQIWFGKPIWSKEVNGVLYAMGSIPAGGFVALPQMVTMESVEGENREGNDALPPIKPIDKIIVAAAGPIFSLGLALVASFLVWGVGKPKDFVHSTEIGYIRAGSPAEKANFQLGDRILSVNGEMVNGFAGSLDSTYEKIMLSEGEKIVFEVDRKGETMTLTSTFDIPETRWYQRRGLREIGIGVPNKTIVGFLSEKGPALRAGLKEDDQILSVDGKTVVSVQQFSDYVSKAEGKTLSLAVLRGDEHLTIPVSPLVPITPLDAKEKSKKRAMIGIGFKDSGEFSREIVHPNPREQISDGLRMMWVTISKVASPKSDIGVQHLAGPIGIGKMMYDLLLTPDGWRRLLSFVVILNVNLAVLNMLPLPILDGGHIVLAVGESIAGRPVRARILEVVQTGFAVVLLGLFLFITSRDIGDNLPGKKQQEITWPPTPAS
jgi:regulator of sigma E protease